jgi:MATE family multidrug resistance protein
MSRTGTHSPFRTELGATLRLAAPLVLANLLQMALGAIDVIFVARLGQEALAASALAVAVFMLISWSLSGLTGAAAPLIAAELGRGRHAVREIRRTVRMALWLAVLSGLGGMVIASFGREILLATGQKPRIADMADGFLDIIKWAIIPLIFGNVLRTFVAALGRPVFATLITALAIGVNVLGNWVFIYGHWGMPAMGLSGSALATVLTGIATVAAYLAAIRSDRRLRRYHVLGRWWRPDWQRLREITALGVPIAAIIVAEGGFFGSAAFLMGRIGEAELAGHTIALQIAALAFQVPFGVGQAATIRVGYHFGAGDRDGIARAGWSAIGVATVFSLVPAAVMVFAPQLTIAIYVDPAAAANLAMTALAARYLLIGAAFQLFDGVQAVAAGALRGLQDTRMPMLIALAGYWPVGFTVSIALGFFTPLAGIGVWIGLAAGLVVVAALLLLRWHRRAALGLLPN